MQRQTYLLTLICVIIFNFIFAQEKEVVYEQFSIRDGLSNSRVYDILEDHNGFLWIGTLDGLCKYDGYSFNVFRNKPNDSTSISSNRITGLFEDGKHNIWTYNAWEQAFNRYNYESGNFNKFSMPWVQNKKYQFTIFEPVEDENNHIWFPCVNGVLKYDQQKFVLLPVPHSEIIKCKAIKIDKNGKLFAHFKDDLGIKDFYFTLKGNQLKELEEIPVVFKNQGAKTIIEQQWLKQFAKPFLKITPDHDGVYWIVSDDSRLYRYGQDQKFVTIDTNIEAMDVEVDRNGVVWVATYKQGILKVNPYKENFKKYTPESDSPVVLRAICSDDKNKYWLGNYENGIFEIDDSASTQKHIQLESKIHNKIRSLYYDNDVVWIGHYDGFSKYDIAREKLTNVYNDKASDVYDFYPDSDSSLWIASWKGVHYYNKYSGALKYYEHGKHHQHIRGILKSQDNYWVYGERLGVLAFTPNQPNYWHEKFELPNENVFHMHEDKSGNLWVATFDGLYKVHPQTFKTVRYTIDDGLPSNNVYGIIGDTLDRLWLSTTLGLSCFEPEIGKFTNYNESDGLHSAELLENAFGTCNNNILVGGTDGFSSFNPYKLKESPHPPHIVLSSLKIFNKEVQPNSRVEGHTILTRSVECTNEITLKHTHSVFTINFTATHLVNPSKNKFEYKLEGVNPDWVEGKSATYTNLNAGSYRFLMRAANTNGVWNEQPKVLEITILPPWWNTAWARTMYVVIGVVLLLLLRMNIIKRQKRKSTLKLEQLKRAQAEEITKVKTSFFTNMSHEFRTPLTLILAPAQKLLLNTSNFSPEENNMLNIIYSNANKMLHLVNQLLDLRKLEARKMEMHVEEMNMAEFLNEIGLSFKELATKKKIRFEFMADQKSIPTWFDPSKFDRVIYNLLSNAFKFTEVNGKVTLKVKQNSAEQFEYDKAFRVGEMNSKTFIQIEIEDSGVGILQDQLKKIFQQFYQVEESNLPTNKTQGTGIGLSITKELIEMHHGDLHVQSVPNQGTKFIIRLPAGKDHFSVQELSSGESPHSHLTEPQTIVNDEIVSEPTTDTKLVLVEDNSDMRKFIRSIFKDLYVIEEASNGKEGLELIKTTQPDLVISDVMMPEMDGKTMCNEIKLNPETSHIPVILLTAHHSLERQLEGLKVGADDFIPKPFHPEVLKSKVHNFLKARQQSRKSYNASKDIIPKDLVGGDVDKEWLEKVIVIIEKNMSSQTFNIDELKNELGMSRTPLHHKIKSITGKSTGEFIRTIKLKHALNMLEQGDKQIAEIAFDIGFAEPASFTKAFKKQFGKTPSEIVNQLTGELGN